MFDKEKNDFDKLLKEVIEPENVDVSTIKFNDTLSPVLWSNNILLPEVRNVLLKNAKNFIEYCDLDFLHFNDIVLVGSMANYNYNDYSDIDVHIIMDFNQISENRTFVSNFFKLKKKLWSEQLTTQIKGQDIEMYIQDINEINYSSGTYSILRNKWINSPTKKIINLDVVNIKIKTADFMNAIEYIEQYSDEDRFLPLYNKLKEKLKKFRQSGLARDGEFSIENIVFKLLRNSGYLERFLNLKNRFLSKELSLNEKTL